MTFFKLQEVQKKYYQEKDLAAAIPNQGNSKASLWIHKQKSGIQTTKYTEANSIKSGSQSANCEYYFDEVSKQ